MFFRTTYADALRVSFTCNSHIWYSSLHDIESIIYWMYKIISNKKHSIYDFFFSFGKSNFKYRLHVLFWRGKTGRSGQSYLGKKQRSF